jgi:aspartate aminotransferase, cytoplasmic
MESVPVSTSSSLSTFDSAPYIPPDLIFEVTKNYLADTHPEKVNVGAGTYRDENGQPWILPSVRMAMALVANCGHEYLPIAGLETFRARATQLVFHHTEVLKQNRVRVICLYSITLADLMPLI